MTIVGLKNTGLWSLTDIWTVLARNVVTIPQGKFTVICPVSALAGLWVIARLLQNWCVDVTTLAFHRRMTSHDSPRSTTTPKDSDGDADA